LLNRSNHAKALIVAALSPAILASCANQKEVTYTSGGMTHTISEGKDAVPKNFPLPLYPDATTSGSVSADGQDQEQSQFLMLSTADSLDKVSEFYQSKLKDSGWQLDKVDAGDKLVSIDAHKDKVQANASLVDDGGKTTISLQLSRISDNPKDESEAAAENYKPDKVTPPTD
jgi:hypothetical protein